MRFSIQKQKFSRLSGLMTLVSSLSILVVHLIRAEHFKLSHFSALLLGCAPNFFGSIALTFLLVILVYIFPAKRTDIDASLLVKRLLGYSFFAFISLALWEYLQYLFWQYPIDNMDILASFIAAVLAFFIGWLYIKQNQEKCVG